MTALYAVAFLSSLGFSIVVPFLVFLVTRFGGNAFVLGAIGAAFWAAQLVGSLWLGALSDRIGRKRVLLRSQLGAMAAWLIFLGALHAPRVELGRVEARAVGAFAVTLPLALIALARITDGVFNGSISVANAYLADLAAGDERKLGYARLGAASSFGFVVGPVIAGLIARTEAGMTAVIALAFVLSAIAALLIRVRLPAVPPRPSTAIEVVRSGGDRVHKALGGGCPEAVRHPRWRVRAVLAIPALRPMIALYFLIYFAFSIYVTALPIHAVADVGCRATQLARVYVTLALMLAVTERFVLPRIVRRLATPVIAAAGCSLLVAAYLLISRSSEAALIAAAALYGVGNGLMWPSYLVMLSRSGPANHQGSIQGVGSSAGSLASILGTVTGGVLFVTIGVATFYVSAVVAGVATCMFAALAPGTGSSAGDAREQGAEALGHRRVGQDRVAQRGVRQAGEHRGLDHRDHLAGLRAEHREPEDPVAGGLDQHLHEAAHLAQRLRAQDLGHRQPRDAHRDALARRGGLVEPDPRELGIGEHAERHEATAR
jgi:MFS family permease